MKLVSDISAAILDTVAALVVVSEPDGRIVLFNRACENTTGYAAAEAMGRRPWDFLVAPEDIEQEKLAFANLRKGAFQTQRDTTWICKDGSRRLISWSNTFVPSATGAAGTIIDTGIDITERSQAEAERSRLLAREQAALAAAEQGNRTRDIFLATVSHELRTPLTTILAWAQLLRRGALDPERTRRALATIEANAKTQGGLIDDLLDISRIIQGKMALRLRPVDVAAIIHEAIHAVQLAADSKLIHIQSRLDRSVGEIQADPTRLQQVIWNLLSNSIKFSPPGSTIRVGLERIQEGHRALCRITVSDEGKGILPQFLPQLFEPFSQADPTPSRAHGGLGLGLAIVKSLVEMHGGKVRAASAGENLGATFTLDFPGAKHRARSRASPHEAPAPARRSMNGHTPVAPPRLDGVRVLVVDDVADSREAVALVLADSGADVQVAASAGEGFDMLVRQRPHVLVSDVAMPGEDGWSLLRRIRSFAPEAVRHTPSIALTAYAGSEDRERALSAGFQGHVAKPFDAGELVSLVAGLARTPAETGSPQRSADGRSSAPRGSC